MHRVRPLLLSLLLTHGCQWADNVRFGEITQLTVASERAHGILLFSGHRLFGPVQQNGKCPLQIIGLCSTLRNVCHAANFQLLVMKMRSRGTSLKTRQIIHFYPYLSKHSMGNRSNAEETWMGFSLGDRDRMTAAEIDIHTSNQTKPLSNSIEVIGDGRPAVLYISNVWECVCVAYDLQLRDDE